MTIQRSDRQAGLQKLQDLIAAERAALEECDRQIDEIAGERGFAAMQRRHGAILKRQQHRLNLGNLLTDLRNAGGGPEQYRPASGHYFLPEGH